MRVIRAFAVICLTAQLSFAVEVEQPREVTDAEIENFVVNHLARKRHGTSTSDFSALLKSCHSDTNRYCRIAQDVYARYQDWQTRLVALSMIDEYGDATQVPFLESCVTDLRNGPMAISVLNRIEGFTSNSVLRTARYHSVTNQEVMKTDMEIASDRGDAIERLVFAATRPTVDRELKNFTRDYVFSYASNNCYQIGRVDRGLIRLDPTYKDSKRRLALLRFAQPGVFGRYGLEYVTNAINELVAYPEANLPE